MLLTKNPLFNGILLNIHRLKTTRNIHLTIKGVIIERGVVYMKASELFLGILLIVVLFSSIIILTHPVRAGCCISHNYDGTYDTSAEQCQTGFYVNKPCSASSLSSYSTEGCCIYPVKGSSVLVHNIKTEMWCALNKGSFDPSVTTVNECEQLSGGASPICENLKGQCLAKDSSIYYCNSEGELVPNCVECGKDICGSEFGLVCNTDTGYCEQKTNNHNPLVSPFGEGVNIINGYVKDESSNQVPYVRVVAYSSQNTFSVLSNKDGFYNITDLPADSYKLNAFKLTYNPASAAVDLNPGEVQVVNFTLTKGAQAACNIDNVVFSAAPVKGKPYVYLSWFIPPSCDNIQVYKVKRSDWKSPELFESDINHFVDKTTQWETQYNYSFSILFSDGSVSNVLTAKITTGNHLCDNIYSGYEFCFDGTNKNTDSAVLRRSCDNNNQITDKAPFVSNKNTQGGFNPSNCSTVDAVCVLLPDLHKTICGTPNYCASLGNPLGLFYDENVCLAPGNPCYYDSSSTIIDKCNDCGHTTCSDFKSEDACQNNNCGLNCIWNYTNKELNKGICYSQYKKVQGNCNACNDLFMDCSAQDCSLLGNCVMSSSGCEACSDNIVCENYTTKETCEGSSWLNDNNNCLPAKSTDSCGLGVCRWINNKCVKDADGNGVPDCTGSVTHNVCIHDTKPLELESLTPDLIVNNENPILSFGVKDSNKYVFNASYCIDSSDSCCPSESANISLDEKGFNINILNDPVMSQASNGIYYLRYYAVDQYHTLSKLETVKFYFVKSPLYILNYKLWFVNDSSGLYNLSAFVKLSEEANCSYTVMPAIASEPTADNSGRFASWLFVSFPKVNPTSYVMRLNCTSKSGDKLSTDLRIKGIGKGYINLTLNTPFKDPNTGVPILTWGSYKVTAVSTKGVNVNQINLTILNGNNQVVLSKPLNKLSCVDTTSYTVCKYNFTLDKKEDKSIANLRGILGWFVVDADFDGNKVQSKDINNLNFAVYMRAPRVTIIIG